MNFSSRILQIIKSNQYFFIPYFSFLIAGILFYGLFGHSGSFHLINGNNNKILDAFFFLTTNMGDGFFFLFALFILVIFSFRYVIYGFFAYITSGLAAQILKHLTNMPRPKGFFAGDIPIHIVSGVAIHSHNSFPSGHAASAFALFILLAAITPNKKFGLFYFLLAFSVAISRVYLAQHFFIDVYVGSLLGVIFTLLVLAYFETDKNFNKLKWPRVSVLNHILRNNLKT